MPGTAPRLSRGNACLERRIDIGLQAGHYFEMWPARWFLDWRTTDAEKRKFVTFGFSRLISASANDAGFRPRLSPFRDGNDGVQDFDQRA
jgi:hypothetical protein